MIWKVSASVRTQQPLYASYRAQSVSDVSTRDTTFITGNISEICIQDARIYKSELCLSSAFQLTYSTVVRSTPPGTTARHDQNEAFRSIYFHIRAIYLFTRWFSAPCTSLTIIEEAAAAWRRARGLLRRLRLSFNHKILLILNPLI